MHGFFVIQNLKKKIFQIARKKNRLKKSPSLPFDTPTTLAVSGQFQQQFQQQFQNKNSFNKSFLENYFIFIYQSRTSIHSSSPLTTLA